MEHAASALCLLRHNNQCSGRYPTDCEIAKGIPRHFRVSEVPRKTGVHLDKYYYSPTGTKYRSIAAIKRSYVQLKVWMNDSFVGVYPFLPSTYASDVTRAFNQSSMTYNGTVYSCERLEDILSDCRSHTVMLN